MSPRRRCSRSGDQPTLIERRLTALFYTPEKRVGHSFCATCLNRVLLTHDGSFSAHRARKD
jgi:hypothetical protein